MRQYHKSYVKDGIYYLNDKKQFRDLTANLPDGPYLTIVCSVLNKTQREFQEMYFAQIGSWSLDTGYTKKELHEIIKNELFKELFDKTSTTDLNKKDWNILFLNLENWLILKFENR